MTGVTTARFDLPGNLHVMFWMSARQGGTDTTAKLLGAAAKWLVPEAGTSKKFRSSIWRLVRQISRERLRLSGRHGLSGLVR